MTSCLICHRNPDNYKGNRPFICSSCTQERVNFIQMLERETKTDIRNQETFGFAYNVWKNKQKARELHKRLKDIRKEKGWTIRFLAEYLGVSHVYLIKMENRRKPLNKKALRFIEENTIEKTNT